MRISKYSEHGLEYVDLENEKIRTTWLPELGGKLVSFIDKSSSSELLHSRESLPPFLSLPKYGAKYTDYIFPGLDECFPTIDASEYSPSTLQNTMKNMYLPEHGEVWALPWHAYSSANEFIFRIHGVVLDYEFEKHIQLQDRSILIRYFLTNNESFSLDYVWAAHADVEISENDQLLLEPSIAKDLQSNLFPLSQSTNDTKQYNDPLKELITGNGRITYENRLLSKSLSEGLCGIYKQQAQIAFVLLFSKQVFSHLAMQISTAFVTNQQRNCHLSLMPSIGFPGALSDAIQLNDYNNIDPQTRKMWKIILKTEKDTTTLNELVAIKCHR